MLERILHRNYRKAIINRLGGHNLGAPLPDGGRTQRLLIMTMFLVMGKLAKMDGRVTVEEIAYATSIIQLMGLSGYNKKKAINYFDQGKQPNYEPSETVHELASLIGKGTPLARLFLRVQCRHAFVKGTLRLKEKMLLRDLAEILGFQKSQFIDICHEIDGFKESEPHMAQSFMNKAYQLLQLEPGVEDSEIRKAYLRMMSKYHPDKFAHGDLTEESRKELQEKAMDIRNAYEALCGFRKIRI